MTTLDDDLLTALRAARPDPGYQPASASPEATAMLAGILSSRRAAAAHPVRRRLLLAGIPAMAAAAAVGAVVASTVTSTAPDTSRLTVSGVRTAVLDAFERDSGDIVYTVRTIQRPTGPVLTQRAWTYPAFPARGQQVRFRLFQLTDGVPVEDTESIYVQDAAAGQLTRSTTQGPRSAEIIDVEYATRTWSRQRSSSVLLAGSLSPSLIRDQIASGGFTVVGMARVDGREAVELTWSRLLGRMSVTTVLWVDAKTYVPLSSVSTTRAGDLLLAAETTSYQVLSATTGNLKLLTPPIPPGFTRVAGSPHF